MQQVQAAGADPLPAGSFRCCYSCRSWQHSLACRGWGCWPDAMGGTSFEVPCFHGLPVMAAGWVELDAGL